MKLRIVVLPLMLLYPLYVGVMTVSRQQQMLFPAASDTHHPLTAPTPSSGQLVEIPVSFRANSALRFISRRSPEPILTPSLRFIRTATLSASRILSHWCAPLVDAWRSACFMAEFPGYIVEPMAVPRSQTVVEAEQRPLTTGSRSSRMSTRSGGLSPWVTQLYGGGAASEVGGQRSVRALRLLSTFPSSAEMAHRYVLPRPLSFVTRLITGVVCKYLAVRFLSNTVCTISK